MEQKYSEQAMMSIPWYQNEIKRLEIENSLLLYTLAKYIGDAQAAMIASGKIILEDKIDR